jgi:murein DD-endopeptidase MepM/ murein hydrolase activator NlpD
MRAAVAALLSLAMLGAATPAVSITEEDVDRARQERDEAVAEREAAVAEARARAEERAAALSDLEDAARLYEEINSEFQEITFRMGQVRSRIDAYESDTSALRGIVVERAVEAYMMGPERDAAAGLADPEQFQQSLIAREILGSAVEADSAYLDALEATTAEMERLKGRLAEDGSRVAVLRAEAEAIADRMDELLVIAQAEYDAAQGVVQEADSEVTEAETVVLTAEQQLAEQRRLEAEEQARIDALRRALATPELGVPMDVTPGFICPVGGVSSFTDTWGAPRSGGRTHKGVDMMGPRGLPLIAVTDGVVERRYGALGGNIVWLYGDHGVSYFYAHLDTFSDAAADGAWVSKGTVIGYMGDTGNPAPGAYHLHFGIYPGGSVAVNPYPTVRAVCP